MEMTSSVLALIDTQRLPGRAALRALRGPMGLRAPPRPATHAPRPRERRAPVRRQGQGRMHETVVYVPAFFIAFFLVVCSYVMLQYNVISHLLVLLTRVWMCRMWIW